MEYIFLFLFLWGAWSLYCFVQKQKKVDADQNFAATISMPYLVTSNHWADTTVFERAEFIANAIRESGNKWNPPVVVIPYRATYVSKTGSGVKSYSSLSKPFHEYMLDCHQIWVAECEHWQAEKIKQHGAREANAVFTGQEMGKGRISWSGTF